ncbi:MAG: hypothetical protein CVV45_03335 [Spirochaetae bacterium HGW-Spirochaetae-10]|nr:MAG: hypothetical protein CVV45_03335 [Spirochaetae bacterium HGW-Spirochaetae-10]
MEAVKLFIENASLRQRVQTYVDSLALPTAIQPFLIITDDPYANTGNTMPILLLAGAEPTPAVTGNFDEIMPLSWISSLPERIRLYYRKATLRECSRCTVARRTIPFLDRHRLRLMFEQLPILIWETDLAGRIQFLEGSLLERIGIHQARYMGKRLPRFSELLKNLSEPGCSVYQGHSLSLIKEVRGIVLRVHIGPVYDENGVIVRIFGIGTDISDLLSAAEVIRKQKRFYEEIIDHIPSGIYVIDPKRNFSVVLSNRSAENLVSSFGGSFAPKSEEEIHELQSLIDHRIEYRRQERFLNLPDERRELDILEIRMETGAEPAFVLGIVKDITQQRRREQEIARARKVAEDANTHKSRIITRLSHELRTPLNTITGFAEIMQSRMDNHPVWSEYIEGIQAAGQSLLQTLNGILDMSRLEAGRLRLREEMVDLRKIIDDMRQMFSGRAMSKGLRFQIAIKEDLPAALFLDELRVKQILLNLIGNAVKFTSSGRVDLSVGCSRSGSPDRYRLEFEITDTGPGILAADIERIFEPFEQSECGIRAGGTGLGLSIASQLARLMNGGLDVVSSPGSGATFRFVMDDVISGAPDLVTGLSFWKLDRASFEGARILIVDNDGFNRRVVLDFLADHDVRIVEAKNGGEAVESCRHERFDLILLDIHMPGMDGYEAVHEIKDLCSRNGSPLPPIIAVTGSSSGEAKGGSEQSIKAWLRKPFAKFELLILLMTYLPYRIRETGADQPGKGRVHPVSVNPDEFNREEFACLRAALPSVRTGLNLAEMASFSKELMTASVSANCRDLQFLAEELSRAIDRINIARAVEVLELLASVPSESGGGR